MSINAHEKLNYLEFPCSNLQASKVFFEQVFKWTFKDYGDEYSAFSSSVMEGGFFKSELSMSTSSGSALIVFYSIHLEQTAKKITDNGGSIIQEIFNFPGGRRFHFIDPSNNEFAVWSDREMVLRKHSS